MLDKSFTLEERKGPAIVLVRVVVAVRVVILGLVVMVQVIQI